MYIRIILSMRYVDLHTFAPILPWCLCRVILAPVLAPAGVKAGQFGKVELSRLNLVNILSYTVFTFHAVTVEFTSSATPNYR